jgi:hypothetical protein
MNIIDYKELAKPVKKVCYCTCCEEIEVPYKEESVVNGCYVCPCCGTVGKIGEHFLALSNVRVQVEFITEGNTPNVMFAKYFGAEEAFEQYIEDLTDRTDRILISK